jgi:FkbM family methyltransferase
MNDLGMIQNHLRHISASAKLPGAHIQYLRKLKAEGVEPMVIYDIGVWPDAQIILFDAFEHSEFLFKESGRPYHLDVLSDMDDKEVKFYQNEIHPGGNSYYKEWNDGVFPPDRFKVYKTRTLDSIVRGRGFPMPDLLKIDVQGAEKDILAGAVETLAGAKHLIVEMQHQQYNVGAPMVEETRPYIESLGWTCVAPLFCNNGPDGDYHFVRAV